VNRLAVVLVVAGLGFGGGWLVNGWRYEAKESKRLAQAVEAANRRDKASYDASVNFEKGKEHVRTVFQKIEVEVEKIVTRTEYRDMCLDPDGLRVLARAVAETATGQPDASVPSSARSD